MAINVKLSYGYLSGEPKDGSESITTGQLLLPSVHKLLQTSTSGSVQETPKGNCMVVKPPFIFAVLSQGLDKLCEWTPLYGEIVKQDDLVPYT